MHLIELNAERDTYADQFYDQGRCIYRSCMLPFTNTQNHNRNETYIQPYVRTCYFFQTLAWRRHMVLNDMLKQRNDDMHKTGVVGLSQN